jgi:hypothetical protein
MRYLAETRLPADEVLTRAERAFGPRSSLGLTSSEGMRSRRAFLGGGGHIVVTTHRRGDRTQVTLETREYDREVRQFLEELPGPPGWLDRLRAWLRRAR